jgi:hypothetical protein
MDQAEAVLSGMGTIYLPVWNVQTFAVSAYLVTPDCDAAAEDSLAFYGQLRPGFDGQRPLAVADRVMASNALECLVLRGDSSGPVLILPLHLSTLENDGFFSPVREQIERLGPAAKRHLVIEILGLPTDSDTPSRLRHRVAALAPLCRGVLLRWQGSRLEMPLLKDLLWLEVHGIGFDLSGLEINERRARQQAVDRFMRDCRRHSVSPYLWGVDTPYDMAMAAVMGAAYAAGSGIGPAGREPGDIYRLQPPAEIMEAMAERGISLGPG